ncbi:MAG: iron-containing alcohol dehydrogenase [Syntrophobacteraceae bacterium]
MTFPSYNTVSRVVHNWGCLQTLPEEIRGVCGGAKKILIVSDPGIEATGILDRVASIFADAGLDFSTFAKVASDPAFDTAEASIAFAKEYKPDVAVGIGGGKQPRHREAHFRDDHQ